jgi:ribonuclease D
VRNADGDGATVDPDVRTLQGWRREVIGSELLDLLAGRRSLRVGPGLDVEVDG